MRFSKALILVLSLALFAIPAMARTSSTHKVTTCSLATLKGAYGFFTHGTILVQLPGLPPPPVPTSAIGIATYDGKGNFSITATQSIDGTISTGTGTGTYTVNPDCTYSDVLTIAGGPVLQEAGTITGRGILREVHIIDIDSWFVNVLTLKKIPPRGCSLETLNGAYGQFSEGTITIPIPGLPTPPFPIAFSGTITFDGEGNLSGQSEGNLGGVIVSNSITGTYDVNADCTLSVVATVPQGVTHETGIITGAGQFREVHNLVTDAGFVVGDALKKQ